MDSPLPLKLWCRESSAVAVGVVRASKRNSKERFARNPCGNPCKEHGAGGWDGREFHAETGNRKSSPSVLGNKCKHGDGVMTEYDADATNEPRYLEIRPESNS